MDKVQAEAKGKGLACPVKKVRESRHGGHAILDDPTHTSSDVPQARGKASMAKAPLAL